MFGQDNYRNVFDPLLEKEKNNAYNSIIQSSRLLLILAIIIFVYTTTILW